MTIRSPFSVIPNLFRNLLLYSRPLQQILKQVQDDERRVKFFPSWLTLLFYGRGKAPRKLSPSMVGENENL